MTLTASRHASGRDWREDSAAPLIVAGVLRRLMDRASRNGGSPYTGLIERERTAATTESVAQMVGTYIDENMPPLPEPELDLMQWTGCIFLETEFRDATTGEVLETVRGEEYDAANPEDRPQLGQGYSAALDRFRPTRDKIDVETFTAYVMKDGTTKRVSLNKTPATRDELAAFQPAPGQHPELFDQAIHDDAVSGLPLVKAEREAARKAERPSPAPTRRRKAKAGS